GDAPSLLDSAEQALLNVKRKGLNRIGLYSATPDKAGSSDGFAERFVEALNDREFRLFYQPLIDAQDGGLSGFGALLRWNTPGHGLLPANQFLDIIERAGLSVRLGMWVIAAAARQLADWRAKGLDYLSLSVHLA